MTNEELMNEIRDTNLSYLILSQNMIRKDKAQALFCLGIDENVADIIAQLSPQQLVKVASRNLMLCTMRFDDEMIWALLAGTHERRQTTDSSATLHASILMAGHSAQSV